jgi:hypothetical protein
MPARKHFNATPSKFRAILELGYEITGNYRDKSLTHDIKQFVLSHRPEWNEYSSAWWSYNFKKCELGVGVFGVERTGLRRKMLPIINASAVVI